MSVAGKAIYEVVLRGALESGQPWSNVFHVEGDLKPEDDPEQFSMSADLCQKLAGESDTEGLIFEWFKAVPAGTTLLSITTRMVGVEGETPGTFAEVDSPPFYVAGATITGAGQRTGQIQSNQACGGVSWLTAAPRRIAKMFLPGLCEADAEAGTFGATYAGVLLTMANAFASGWDSGGLAGEVKVCVWNAENDSHYAAVFAGRVARYIWNQKNRRVPI